MEVKRRKTIRIILERVLDAMKTITMLNELDRVSRLIVEHRRAESEVLRFDTS